MKDNRLSEENRQSSDVNISYESEAEARDTMGGLSKKNNVGSEKPNRTITEQ